MAETLNIDRQRIEEFLKKLGFTDYERAMYICLIKYGPQQAGQIAKLSKIPRSKIYEVARRLRRKGFVSKVEPEKGVIRWVPNNPRDMFFPLFSEIKDNVETLSFLYKNSTKGRFPSINLITSKEGIKNLFVNILEKSKTLLLYLDNDEFRKILGYTFETRIKKIRNKKVKCIFSDKLDLRKLAKDLKAPARFAKTGGANFIVTDSKVILDLWLTQYVMIEINSKETVETFRKLFDCQWKAL